MVEKLSGPLVRVERFKYRDLRPSYWKGDDDTIADRLPYRRRAARISPSTKARSRILPASTYHRARGSTLNDSVPTTEKTQ